MNFSLPINLDKLQNDRLKLVPLDLCPDKVNELFFYETNVVNPELWLYFPRGPFATLESYLNWYTPEISHNATRVIFAVLLKAGTVVRRNALDGSVETLQVEEGTFAGTSGLTDASLSESRAEIGFAIVLPKFQRTFVNSDACCLLLKHLLDPVEGGDLGLRRVQWQANSKNQASIRAAQRLGFTLEGIMRWQRVCTENKKCISEENGERTEGLPREDVEGRKLGPGRHSAMLALCWDDWLDGGRERTMSMLLK